MSRAALLLVLSGVAACSSDEAPRINPDIAFPNISVVEGGSTTFLFRFDAPPTFEITGRLQAVDQTVAIVMPDTFDVSPPSDMAMMTVFGVDDMKPAGNRGTNFNGEVEDNGTTSGGSVTVIDRESPSVTSSAWKLVVVTVTE